jgi:hypothetical protein
VADNVTLAFSSLPVGVAVLWATALICALLSIRCPSTVARFVVSVVVDPIYRVLPTWARAHVGQKVLKGILPSSTHTNTAPAIVFVFNVFGLAASLHSAPCLVFNGFAQCVSTGTAASNLFLEAPTAFVISPDKVGRKRDRRLTAVASTEPPPLESLARGNSDYFQTRKSFSDQIVCSHSGLIISPK